MSEPPPTGAAGTVRLGALTIRLDADDPIWVETLAVRFRSELEPGPTPDPDVVLVVVSSPDVVAPLPGPECALAVRRRGSTVHYDSGLMDLEADLGTRPVVARLRVRPAGQIRATLHHFFAVHLDGLLLALGALRLHGAAIELSGTTNVFLGDKGAGKSTMSLALGLAGGRVLADDQLLLRRTESGIAVSGGDGNVRLTADTEAHLLSEPLAVEPVDRAGVLKKEVALGDLVTSIPHVDVAPRRLFFARVGDRFAVRAVSKRDAVTRIVGEAARHQRFGDAVDRVALLALVGDFVAPLETADLELSPDLRDLDRLVDHLGR